MPKFGKASRKRLKTLHPLLQEIVWQAIDYFDFTIVCGYRNEQDQNKAVAEGASTKKWPESRHNVYPSQAVDVAPWNSELKCIDWENKERFIYLTAFILGVAHARGIKVRWGGDFNQNTYIKDGTFIDMPHIELVE